MRRVDWRAPLLEGKAALITGSGSGQGRAAALAFAQHGARIAVIDIDDAGAAETVRQVKSAGGSAFALHADVSLRPDCDKMVQAAVDQFGRLDVLYNNAAVQMSGTLLECTEEQWDLTLATNLSAIFWACRAAIPHMLAGGGGSILNTASTLGLIGSPGFVAYGAAKAGLIALTRQIAVEYAPLIRANVIAPGSIDTPRFQRVAARQSDPAGYVEAIARNVPQRRLGSAEDVAGIALFLASDLSAYTSGAVVPADGGLAALR
jgi:NAD(P)-dependent dehydrogenase (short-subunit alcohol dehydrogenase family)